MASSVVWYTTDPPRRRTPRGCGYSWLFSFLGFLHDCFPSRVGDREECETPRSMETRMEMRGVLCNNDGRVRLRCQLHVRAGISLGAFLIS
jgi:hypothetical protein